MSNLLNCYEVRPINKAKNDIFSNKVLNKCPKCGSYIEHSNKFCPNCGCDLKNYKRSEYIFKMEKLDNGKFKIVSLNKKDIFSVQIPNCISVIGENAFKGSSVIKVKLNEGLVKIEKGAFADCKYLKEINFPNTLRVIEDEVFKNCSSLDVKLPSYLTYVGNNVLLNNLNDIKYNEYIKSLSRLYDLEKLADNTFKLNKVLDNEITTCILPDIISVIDSKALLECKSLQKIMMPNSIKTIYLSSFEGLKNLISIKIPSSVTNIIKANNSSNIYLKNIVVDENNKFYDSRENCNCIINSLNNELILAGENFIIPNGLSIIKNSSFSNITKDVDIFIPKSLIDLDVKAFHSFTKYINTINVEDGNPIYLSEKNCNSIIVKESNSFILGCKNSIIPSCVESICKNAFYECESPLRLNIPADVKYIDESSFMFINNRLESIFVSYYNDYYSCMDKNIILDKKEKTLILGCYNSKIPHCAKLLGEFSFRNCKNLRKISIPKHLKLFSYAFYGCENLKR